MKSTLQKLFSIFLGLILLSSFGGCGSGDKDDLLIFPQIVVIDSVLSRVFVIDNQQNRINLVDPNTDRVVKNKDNDPLLDDEDPILIQLFPSNAAVVSLTGGVSRLFIIGANNSPSQQIIALDYNGGDAFVPAPFSPINVPASDATNVLVGIAVVPDLNLVFVTNTSTGLLHFFDVNTGIEDPNSPIALPGEPGRIAVDWVGNWMAIANSGDTRVSFVDLSDLTAPVQYLDVGNFSRDVGIASNTSGSILFVSGIGVNISEVYQLNEADLSSSNLIFELTPPGPADPLPDPLLITGNLNLISAGNLTDGRMAGFYTQSSGDLLALDLTNDLTSLSPAVINVGSPTGEGIANLFNGSNQVTKVYFVSPGTGVMTVIDPLTNEFVDQVP